MTNNSSEANQPALSKDAEFLNIEFYSDKEVDHLISYLSATKESKFNFFPKFSALYICRSLTFNTYFWPSFYLILWFSLNMGLTLYSKIIFSVLNFSYPIFVTALHLTFTYLGVKIMQLTGLYIPKVLRKDGWKIIILFSFLFFSNIWLSNASLSLVSISFHQVARSLSPLFTVAITWFIFREKYPLALLYPTVIIIIGVAFSVWGDMRLTLYGVIVVMLSTLLSSLKGLITQKAQIGAPQLKALDLLNYICPVAVAELILFLFVTGEFNDILQYKDFSLKLVLHLCAVGIIAFFVNFVSFRCAVYHNPLTLNVAANVKQVLTSVCGIHMLQLSFNVSIIIGIVLTAIGAFWYTYQAQKRKPKELT